MDIQKIYNPEMVADEIPFAFKFQNTVTKSWKRKLDHNFSRSITN